jgi:hypothetical protein
MGPESKESDELTHQGAAYHPVPVRDTLPLRLDLKSRAAALYDMLCDFSLKTSYADLKDLMSPAEISQTAQDASDFRIFLATCFCLETEAQGAKNNDALLFGDFGVKMGPEDVREVCPAFATPDQPLTSFSSDAKLETIRILCININAAFKKGQQLSSGQLRLNELLIPYLELLIDTALWMIGDAAPNLKLGKFCPALDAAMQQTGRATRLSETSSHAGAGAAARSAGDCCPMM